MRFHVSRLALCVALAAAAGAPISPLLSAVQAQQAPVAPRRPPLPPKPRVVAPFSGSEKDFEDSVDAFGAAMDSMGESMGRAGEKFGQRMRARFGPRFRDSIRAELAASAGQLRASQQSLDRASAQLAKAAAKADAHATAGDRRAIAAMIERVRSDPQAIPLPPTDSFVVGDVKIVTDSFGRQSTIAVKGNLDIVGTIHGDAIAIGGDVILHPGSHVTGSAFAADGEVRLQAPTARVDGEIRSIRGVLGPPPTVATAGTRSPQSSRMHDFRLALSGFGLVMLLGIGILTFAEEQLDDVTATLTDKFGRAAWYGVVGQLGLVPALAALLVALTITIVGILALPFAFVGYAVLAAGAVTLGFVAVAEATGTALLRKPSQVSLTPRGAQLRAIVTGIAVYGGLWMLTAIVGIDSGVGVVLRGVSIAVTGVAVTVGFGAVLLWRFEIRRANKVAKAGALPPAAADAVWQTPTPVAGVAAARRPTPPAVPTTPRTPE